MGLAKNSSAVPCSKSRSSAALTKIGTISMPSRVNAVSHCATTIGALRYTLPMPPPSCTASLAAAPKPSSANSTARNHSSGERSCSRSSKRKNSRIMRGASGSLALQAQLAEVHVLQVRIDALEAVLRALRTEHVDHRLPADQACREHGVVCLVVRQRVLAHLLAPDLLAQFRDGVGRTSGQQHPALVHDRHRRAQ